MTGTATQLQLTTTQVTSATAAAFWKGGADNWSTAANWNSTAAGGATAAGAPDYQTNVNFATTTPVATNLTTNVLDVDFDINSLTFNAAAGGVILGGTRMLTIEATNANGNTAGSGITSSNSSGTNMISTNVGLAANQTWTVNSGGALAVSGVISDFGGGYTLTKAGGGTLVLSGANAYTGAVTVSAGVLNIQNGNALGTAAAGISVSSGAALQLQGGISVGAETLSLNGIGISGDGALRSLDGGNTYAGLLTLTGSARINSDAGTLMLTHLGTITGSSFGLTVGGAGNTTINSIIGTLSGTLTKDGTGTLTLNGASTYTGATIVKGGVLRAGVVSVTGTSGAFGLNSAVTLANVAGATLDLNGFSTQIGSLSGGGTSGGNVTLGTATLTLAGGSTPLPFAGVISGIGGALTLSGSGTLTLTGANTYTGATTISAGTLQLGNGGTTGSLSPSSAISITSGATLVFNRSNAVTQGTDFAAAISIGCGGVTQNGPGTLTFSGANAYIGGTTVNGGTLVLAFGAVTSNIITKTAFSSLTLGGGTLQLTGAGTQAFAGLTTKDSTGSRILMGSNQTLTVGPISINGTASALNFNTTAGGANGATVGTGVVVLTGQTAGTAISSGFTVTDSGGFGLATVDGSNQVIRLAGTTLLPVNGGTSATNYRVDNNNGGTAAAGSSSLTIATLEAANSVTVDTTTASGVVTLGSGVVLSNNTWNFGGTGSNTWQIANAAGAAAGTGLKASTTSTTIEINNYASGTVTFSSPILNNTSTAVNVKGTGTTVFAGANNYSAGTTVRGGTLQVITGGSITHTASSMTVGKVSGDNGTLSITGGNVSNSSAAVGSAAGSTGTVTVSNGSWTNSSTLAVGSSGIGVLNLSGGTVSNTTATLGSSVSGSGTVTVSSGSWTNSSSLTIGNSGTGVMNISGGGVSSVGGTIGCAAGGSGTATVSGGSWTNSSSLVVGNSTTGELNITGGGVSNTTGTLGFNAGSSGAVTVSGGSWTNSSSLSVGRSGTGALTIAGSGVVNVNTGTGTLTLGANSGSVGTLNLGTGGTAGTLNAASVTAGSGAAMVNFNQSGSYTFAPTLSGGLAVNQVGSGTTTLATANTYSGATTVSAGTLNVTNTSGSATVTGAVTVAAGAILSGTGAVTNGSTTINGTLTIGDSTISSPVASSFTLGVTGGGITLGSTGALRFDLFSGAGARDNTASVTASDLFILYGDISLLSGAKLLIDNPNNMSAWAIGDQWRLWDVTNAGTRTGSFALGSIVAPMLSGIQTWSFDSSTGILSIVPEPGRASLLLLSLCALLLRRRRK